MCGFIPSDPIPLPRLRKMWLGDLFNGGGPLLGSHTLSQIKLSALEQNVTSTLEGSCASASVSPNSVKFRSSPFQCWKHIGQAAATAGPTLSSPVLQHFEPYTPDAKRKKKYACTVPRSVLCCVRFSNIAKRGERLHAQGDLTEYQRTMPHHLQYASLTMRAYDSRILNHVRDRWASVRQGIWGRSGMTVDKVEQLMVPRFNKQLSPRLLLFMTHKLKSTPVPRHVKRQY